MDRPADRMGPNSELLPGENTTIGVVATDAKLTKKQANRVATVAHDGIARAMRPAHTMNDGDTIFCIATAQSRRHITRSRSVPRRSWRGRSLGARGTHAFADRWCLRRPLGPDLDARIRGGDGLARPEGRTVHGVGVCRRAIRFRA
jgi:hypothetical protein